MRSAAERQRRSLPPAPGSTVIDPERACSPDLIVAMTLPLGSRWPGLHSNAPRRNTLLALVCFVLALFSIALLAFVPRFVLA
jgi:hypothetical protein